MKNYVFVAFLDPLLHESAVEVIGERTADTPGSGDRWIGGVWEWEWEFFFFSGL